MAYRKTAKNLVHGLGIEIGKPLERRNGQVILSASVWLDPYDKIDGKTKISRDSAERIRRLMQDVEAFANWAKLTMLAAGAATFRNTLGQDRTVISRKRLRMSDRMEVVTYHTRFEFCFNQAVAVKLQEFIVTHYPMKTENAA